MKYKTIVVDPPWKYGIWGKGGKNSQAAYSRKSHPLPYPSLSLDQIKALPVATLADENCDLYLWTTQKYLPKSFPILRRWGFKYCQLLTWCKTPMGTGQGGLFCPTTEFIILARKGKMPTGKRRVNTTWFNWKRAWKTHSKKPADALGLIEVVSDAPRIELFARTKRPGWDVWGNEVESNIDLFIP